MSDIFNKLSQTYSLSALDIYSYNSLANPDSIFFFIFKNYTYSFSFYKNMYLYLSQYGSLSYLDNLLSIKFLKEHDDQDGLYYYFILDFTSVLGITFFTFKSLFFLNLWDPIVTILHFSPEIILALMEYDLFFWEPKKLSYRPTALFNFFFDTLNSTDFSPILDYIYSIFTLFFFITVTDLFRIKSVNQISNTNLYRFYLYTYSLSKEVRANLEIMVNFFLIFFLFLTVSVFTFDDDREIFIENIDNFFFFLFILFITFLLYKCSIHYFAFLESSINNNKSIKFVIAQSFRDFINTFALFLRFFVLIFRMNVYDTLDDFYDSYYIFVDDFDDNSYIDDAFWYIYTISFFNIDNLDDYLSSLEEESSLLLDIIYIPIIAIFKLYNFFFFILEELFRISLAFYICYLIVFEVHSLNTSYLEDVYIRRKRS